MSTSSLVRGTCFASSLSSVKTEEVEHKLLSEGLFTQWCCWLCVMHWPRISPISEAHFPPHHDQCCHREPPHLYLRQSTSSFLPQIICTNNTLCSTALSPFSILCELWRRTRAFQKTFKFSKVPECLAQQFFWINKKALLCWGDSPLNFLF